MKNKFYIFTLLLALLCSAHSWGEELTVASRTTTNGYVPLYCSYGDGVGTKSQFIYPSSMLTDLEGKTLTGMVFHADKNITWANGGTIPTFAVRLKEVDESALTAFISSATLTEVYNGQPDKGTSDLAFEFDNAFSYTDGKNLLVEVEVVVAGGWQAGVNFHGTYGDENGSSMYKYGNNSGTKSYFLPEATITYTAGSAPSCAKPTDLDVPAATLTSNSAQVTWSTEASSSNLQYKAGNADWITVEGVTSPYDLTVEPETSYQVKVQAVCGAEDISSYTSAFAFTTPCGAKSLPFEADFSSALSSCWTLVDCHADSKVDGGRFKFRYNTTPPQYLITPELNTGGREVTVDFNYWIASSTYPETFQVGYSTSTNDVSAFTYEDEVTASTYGTKTYSTTFPAETKYVAIKYNSNNKSALYIDDLRIAAVPTCLVPTALTASSVTANSATLSWTEGKAGDNAWIVEYSTTSDFSSDVHSVNVTAMSKELTGLEAQTTYYARVKTNCGANGESEYSETISFKTACGAQALPFEEYFSGTIDCWTKENCHASTDITNGEFKFFYQATPPSQYLITPELEVLTKEVQVVFDYRVSMSYYKESFIVGYSTTTNDLSAFTWGTELTDLANTDFVNYSEKLPAGVKYVAIQCTSNDKAGLFIDNFKVEEAPSCTKPTLAEPTALTPEGASFTWEAGGDETQYQYCVVASGEAADGWITLEENVRNLTITGKDANTAYDFYVRSYCNTTDQSEAVYKTFTTALVPEPTAITVTGVTNSKATISWTSPDVTYAAQYQYALVESGDPVWSEATTELSHLFDNLTANTTYTFYVRTLYNGTHMSAHATQTFTTLCDPITISSAAYEEHFEAFPDCWDNSKGTTTNESYKWSLYSGGKEGSAVRFDSKNNGYNKTNILASPLFILDSDADLTFWVKNKKGGDYVVMISVDGNPREELISSMTNIADWTKKEASLGLYQGHTIQLFFCGTSNWSESNDGFLYLDELAITPQSCRKPAELNEATSITSDGATFTWSAGGSASDYQYAVVEAGQTPVWDPANVVSAQTVTVSGLTASTSYDFYVRTYCDELNQSEPRQVTFKTACGVYGLPFVQDFNSVTAYTIPECWDNIEGTVSSETQRWRTDGYSVRFNSSTTENGLTSVLATPTIQLGEGDYLTFTCKNPTGGDFKVQIQAEGEARADLLTGLTGIADWTKQEVDLAAYNGKKVQFFFCATSNEGDQYAYISVDEIRVAATLVLPQEADNSAVLAQNIGVTTDMQLNRTFFCDNSFNTICLPFDLPTLEGTPLEGGQILAFKYGYVENGELLLRVYPTESIEAGVPYLISWDDGENIVSPLFKNITITASTGKSIGENDDVHFVGIFAPETFPQNDKTKLFVLANNQIAWSGVSESGHSLKSFRAYFQTTTAVGGSSTNAPIRHGMPARIVLQEQTATGSENIETGVQSIKILENNQVVIIRNGLKYNLQGQRIQ